MIDSPFRSFVMSESEQTHLIGGITGGVGSAIARALCAAGHKVAGFARDETKLSALSDELGVTVRPCDATDSKAVAAAIEDLGGELGTIDAYTHAIGSIYLKPAHLTSDEDWHRTIDLNLNSAFYAFRTVSKIMSKQGHGSCLFFSTAAAHAGIASHEAIAAAKGGIDAMVRAAAAGYCGRGIRVNAIAPSLTNTPLSKPIVGTEQGMKISKSMHPLGDITQPEDVASLAQWLHSPQAKFATGQTYLLDGGISSIVPKPRA
jgi:NAD(P)-dependent dehydrogenase (short-subunit alcohol dehydrogenase family)